MARPSTSPGTAALLRTGYSSCSSEIGYELIYSFPQPTPIILVVNVHDSRASDIVVADHPDLRASCCRSPATATRFGNQCHRVLAPAGRLRLSADGIVNDSGQPDELCLRRGQDTVEDLPERHLVFLLGSRYCETDLLSETAWQLFGGTRSGIRARAGDLRLRS